MSCDKEESAEMPLSRRADQDVTFENLSRKESVPSRIIQNVTEHSTKDEVEQRQRPSRGQKRNRKSVGNEPSSTKCRRVIQKKYRKKQKTGTRIAFTKGKKAKNDTRLEGQCKQTNVKNMEGFLKPSSSAAANQPVAEKDDDAYWNDILLKRQSVQTNLENLNMDSFQSWLYTKSPSNDVTTLLMLNILCQDKVRKLLDYKISQLRSDLFLLNHRSTNELYVVLVDIIKDMIQEDLQKVDKKYSSTLNFLANLRTN